MLNKTYIGFDIGASHLRAVIRRGKTARVITMKTPRTKKAFSAEIRKIINNASPVAVGISIAGVIKGMKLEVSPNEPALSGLELRSVIPQRIPLVVDNDARAFAYGEYKAGAGKGAKRLLAFTIGTGVGRAFVAGGKLQKIKSFERPEKWEKAYQRIWDKKLLAQFLATHLQSIISRYRPDRVIFGGGVVLKHPAFFLSLEKELEGKTHVSVRKAKLGDLGAAHGMIYEVEMI